MTSDERLRRRAYNRARQDFQRGQRATAPDPAEYGVVEWTPPGEAPPGRRPRIVRDDDPDLPPPPTDGLSLHEEILRRDAADDAAAIARSQREAAEAEATLKKLEADAAADLIRRTFEDRERRLAEESERAAATQRAEAAERERDAERARREAEDREDAARRERDREAAKRRREAAAANNARLGAALDALDSMKPKKKRGILSRIRGR